MSGFLVFFLASLVLALAFIEAGMPWISAIIMIGFAIYALTRTAEATVHTTKRIGKTIAAGVKEDVEHAHGAHPSAGLWKESLHEVGEKAGEQAFAPEYHKFKMKPWGPKLSKGIKKLVKGFKELFEE